MSNNYTVHGGRGHLNSEQFPECCVGIFTEIAAFSRKGEFGKVDRIFSIGGYKGDAVEAAGGPEWRTPDDLEGETDLFSADAAGVAPGMEASIEVWGASGP